VVLGAGRSGTSALTRGLAALGVELGDRLRAGGGKNPTGFFEDEDVLAVTKRLKHALGVRGDSLSLIPSGAWRSAPLRALEEQARETIRRRFGDRSLWGFKNGRTLRLLPFWEAVFGSLELDVRYVVAARNPLSVARSRGALDPRRGKRARADLEWLVNVVPYFRLALKRPLVVVDYDLLMAGPRSQLERIARTLEIQCAAGPTGAVDEYARVFLRPSMRHSQYRGEDLESDEVNLLVRDAYRWLERLAADEIEASDGELRRDWQRLETELARLGPVLSHLDQIEAELRRAEWNPASPLKAALRTWRKIRERWP
jgi:hypothetical protein